MTEKGSGSLSMKLITFELFERAFSCVRSSEVGPRLFPSGGPVGGPVVTLPIFRMSRPGT